MRNSSANIGLFRAVFVALLLLFIESSSLHAALKVSRFDRVIIDPGHGGADKGALWGGVRESTLNLKVAKRLEKKLKARGVPVIMTRKSDVYVSLKKRIQIANRYQRAVLVSIHFNATTVGRRINGIETYYYGVRGKPLAYEIHKQLVGRMKIKDRKLRKRRYVVLTDTRCPAVLVECGYMSNPTQLKKAQSSTYQEAVAESLMRGLVEFKN